VLVEKAVEWTEQYRQALAAGGKISDSVRFRYRHEEIKIALREESHNKCIYCETPIGFGETDHINPVSRCPDQIVAWENLALVCTECNTHKSHYYDPSQPLVNPFCEEPADFLLFLGPLVMAVPGSARGRLTELQLKLNRVDLFQRRCRRLEALAPLLDQWALTPQGRLKDLLRDAIQEEAGDEREYAATVRACLLHTQGWTWQGGRASA
jgi:hypothetical protein